jgi:hypothetical protein
LVLFLANYKVGVTVVWLEIPNLVLIDSELPLLLGYEDWITNHHRR